MNNDIKNHKIKPKMHKICCCLEFSCGVFSLFNFLSFSFPFLFLFSFLFLLFTLLPTRAARQNRGLPGLDTQMDT
jgi:hypothetical protein